MNTGDDAPIESPWDDDGPAATIGGVSTPERMSRGACSGRMPAVQEQLRPDSLEHASATKPRRGGRDGASPLRRVVTRGAECRRETTGSPSDGATRPCCGPVWIGVESLMAGAGPS